MAALLLGVATLSSAAGPPRPKGHLLMIGGGPRPPEIMGKFRELAGGARARVLVFPQASSRAEAGPELQAELRDLGLGEVVLMSVDRAQADGEEAVRRMDGASGVYFGGGDQSQLTGLIKGTRIEARLHELYRAGAVIAGTSAGAAVMSRLMITGDERRPYSKEDAFQTIESGDVVTGEGFGFLEDVVVDQHFVRRRRHNRLLSVVLENPRLAGVAIDESTAVWVRPDRTFEVIGDGPVLVYDAGSAQVEHDAGYGLRGAGLRLHVLRRGSLFDLDTREVKRLGPS